VTGEVKMRTTKKAQGAARNHKCHSTRAQLEKTKRRRGKIREQDFFEDRDLWLSRPRVDPNTFSDPSQGPEEDPKLVADRAREQTELARELGWSDGRLALFKQVIDSYNQKPTIESYLTMRRTFPEVEIAIDWFGGFWGFNALDPLVQELRRKGIDRDAVTAALHFEEQNVDALCLTLMEDLLDRDRLPKSGPRHIQKRRERSAIPPSTISSLYSWNCTTNGTTMVSAFQHLSSY
jgi:hypothetical protein